MRVLQLFGPVAVLCGGLVLGAGTAALTDDAAFARVSIDSVGAINAIGAPRAPGSARPGSRTLESRHASRSTGHDTIALRVIGLPLDGTIVPGRLVPPSLRYLVRVPETALAASGPERPSRRHPLRIRGARRGIGPA